MQTRMRYLDGLRGIAILLVVLFHAFSRWPEIVPYGDTYASFPLFRLGWVGVELFFLISGFVIFMSMDKTQSFLIFIYKRWLRLFPTMLLASLLIFFSAPLFYERPAGMPNASDLIPGITFTEPFWWGKLLGTQINSLEGAFWSLYVEFKFYIIGGLIYYSLGRRFLIPALLFMFIGSYIITTLHTDNSRGLIALLFKISTHLSFEYFGWFSAGALFYLYQQSRRESHYFMAIIVAIASSLNIGIDFGGVTATIIVSWLFALSLRSTTLQKVLTSGVFMFFGLISYPLYLMHENAMISMIVKSHRLLPHIDMIFYPILPVMFLGSISFILVRSFEPWAKLYINGAMQKILPRYLKEIKKTSN